VKPALLALVAMGLAGAPFQCASDPDPNRRMEDTAPEALWELSERFEAQGERGARRETLRHLVDRYPSSRYARRAELALERAEEPGEPDPTPTPPADAPAP
jgi:hypothetical protein